MAISGLSLLQVTALSVPADSAMGGRPETAPTLMGLAPRLGVTLKSAAEEVTVTLTLALLFPSSVVTVMETGPPALTPVTTPVLASTLAIAASALDQVTFLLEALAGITRAVSPSVLPSATVWFWPPSMLTPVTGTLATGAVTVTAQLSL
jgi:hypothetical protein